MNIKVIKTKKDIAEKNSVVRATLKENNNAGNWSTLFIPQGAIFLYNFKGLQHFLKDAVSHNLLDAV